VAPKYLRDLKGWLVSLTINKKKQDTVGRMGANVTLGLSRNQSVWRTKVIRLLSIIHNGIILDLVCGFGGSVSEEASC